MTSLQGQSRPDATLEREPVRSVAVLVPCYNEEVTVAQVVTELREALPEAEIFVYDNASTDATAERAAAAGATVRKSPRRGKGNVVRHMFREIEADAYLLIDGDGTYPADMAPALVELLRSSNVDMVVGSRLDNHDPGAFPAFHLFGNKVISGLISRLFKGRVTDVLSGYRVLTKDLVNTLYLRSHGFDIETELTLQTLVRGRSVRETPIRYGTRSSGSISKLNTWSDGWRILSLMLLIFRDYKPLVFFSALSFLCFAAGLAFGWVPIADYIQTRFVSHVPLALLAAALEILAALFLGTGLILDAIARFHNESQERIRAALGRDSDDSPRPG